MERPEHRLLLGCVRACGSDERRGLLLECLEEPIDWEYLLQAADKHRLTSLLYWHLNACCRDDVPEPVLQRLRQHFMRNAAAGLLLGARLRQILAALEAQGIPAIPFKGPVLAEQLYEDPACREFDDLDILVQQHDVFPALGVLRELGCRTPRDYPARVRAQLFARDHHLCAITADGQLSVEIHWNLLGPALGPRFPVERWWARASAGRLGTQPVIGLVPEDLLAALLIHGSRHGWESLRWVADIAALCTRYPRLDWEQLWRDYENPDIRQMLGLGLVVSHELAGALVPEALLSRAQGLPGIGRLAVTVVCRMFEPLETSEFRRTARDVLFQARLMAGWKGRSRYLLKRAFSPPPADWEFSLPKPLFPLYFLLRPVQFLRRQRRRP